MLWISAVLVGCCFMVSPRLVSERTDLVTELKSQTVAFVDRENSDDGMVYGPYCAGIWVTERHILTAKHCVTANEPILNTFYENGMPIDLTHIDMEYVTIDDVKDVEPRDVIARRGRTVAVDDHQDLAVIEAHISDLPKHPIARLTTTGPRDGEDVHIIGHTMRMYWTYLRGNVSATRSPIFDYAGNATKALQVASAAYKGNSGGGAWNEMGDLVGLMSWMSNISPEMGFFLHHDEIEAFLRDNNIRNH